METQLPAGSLDKVPPLWAIDKDHSLQEDVRHADPGDYLGRGDLTDDIIPTDPGYDMGHEDLTDNIRLADLRYDMRRGKCGSDRTRGMCIQEVTWGR